MHFTPNFAIISAMKSRERLFRSTSGQLDGQTIHGASELSFDSRTLVHITQLEACNYRLPSIIRHYARNSVRLAARNSLVMAKAGAELDGFERESSFISTSVQKPNSDQWLDWQRIRLGCGEVHAFRLMFASCAETELQSDWDLDTKAESNPLVELTTDYILWLYGQLTRFIAPSKANSLVDQKKLSFLLDKLNWELDSDSVHPVAEAAWIYWYLNNVEVFPLGNKSMARLLSVLMLQVSGFGFVAYTSVERKFHCLRSLYSQSLTNSDPSSFARMFIEQLNCSAQQLEMEIQKLWTDGPGPPAVIRLLDLIAELGQLTTNQAAEALNLPKRSVRRYLKQLVDNGWLLKTGPRGKQSYFLNLNDDVRTESKLRHLQKTSIPVGTFQLLPSNWPQLKPRWQPSSPWSWPLASRELKTVASLPSPSHRKSIGYSQK